MERFKAVSQVASCSRQRVAASPRGPGPDYSPKIRGLVESGLFDRLPATFSIYSLNRIKDWDRLFPAEHGYFGRLFGLLDQSSAEVVEELFGPLRDVDRKMNVGDGIWRTRRFTLEHVDFLQRSRHLAEWRDAIAGIFAKIDPLLDEEVARAGNPRLVAVVSPAELPMGPDRMWTHIRAEGCVLPLRLGGNDTSLADYLARLLTGAEPRRPLRDTAQSQSVRHLDRRGVGPDSSPSTVIRWLGRLELRAIGRAEAHLDEGSERTRHAGQDSGAAPARRAAPEDESRRSALPGTLGPRQSW